MIKKVMAMFLALSLPCTLVMAEGASGTYTGKATGFGGDIVAEVTLEEGVITDVVLTGEGETPTVGGVALEPLAAAFVEAGGADVAPDVVTGASFTRDGAIQAVKNALAEAEGGSAEVTEPAGFTPGTYTATVAGHNSDFEIEVTFSEDKIEDIQIGENVENHSVGDRAMLDIGQIILEKQSLNVDAIAGATVTSKGFLAAVADAVKQAGADPMALQAPTQEEAATPEDTTVDVVVVGGGSAGLAATVEAKQQGLNVILLEQLGILGGASGRFGYIMAVDTKVHEEQGIEMTVEDLMANYGIDSDLTRDFENATKEDVNWLYDLGVEFGPVNLNTQIYGPNGARLGGYYTEAMRSQMDKLGVDYRLNSRGESLIVEDGKVTGIVVKAPNGELYNIYADAVILCTGGYFANEEMTDEYFPGWGSNPFDCGIGADGSGMLMAQDAGAQLINLDYANFHAIAGYFRGASRSLTLVAGNGGIAVNSKGERFFNEAGDYTAFTQARDQQDRVISIFDQTIADLDVIKGDVGCAATWGMYTVCDTLEEVAEAFDIDLEGLQKTVDAYAAAYDGAEDEFGKPAAYLRTNMLNPPYYAVDTLIENHTTYGGINTAADTHVLDADGNPIPGLFAAGECTNKKTYMLGNAGACIYEGRTAVNTFLAER